MLFLRRLMKCTAASFLALVGAIIGNSAGSVSDRACESIALIFVVTLGMTFYYGVGYAAGRSEQTQENPDLQLDHETKPV